ncbi:golgin subfamily A member 2 isoform X2 [Drosophila grimshawi]|uniref:golgin subfamily A member 2 isoform X2 n=1 Tax=Drosophila grimshawi TaxID=7222 RepID=UPI000C87021E|nr:golgin subfamily A member 2 isoform X2 [Drosophila grimshawi]
MQDDTQDAKAQKLAAARKKLKEYQQRTNNNNMDEHSSTVSIASNLSERSDCELSLSNGAGIGIQAQQQMPEQQIVTATAAAAPLEPNPTGIAAYFAQPEPTPSVWPHNGQGDTSNLQAIQVLIAEKGQLNTELTKSRHLCRERQLELEELRTEQGQTLQRLEQVQQHCQEQQRSVEQQRNQNAELQHNLALANAQIEDQQTHLGELQAQLGQLNARQDELQQQLADKSNELEMAQLKIRQLSDESHVNTDNRVETLTQTQYMYEQQIRDLQQMVSQLTQDKEQAAVQYQSYVANLKERNSELSDECAQLKERERQLIEHVSGLERDIQKNLALQAQYKDAAKEASQPKPEQPESTAPSAELVALQERISDMEFERHEFQLKIKSQDDQLQLKEEKLSELQLELQRLQTNQPDQIKLLATMESDKVAASRAVSQNVDMKQQLDELEQRFVQLTNDKLELVNKLDAEEFANREMRSNYAQMEQKLHANEERFKFKDEEMIRLSHENVELQRMQLMQQQQLDRLQHYEVCGGAKVYHNQQNAKESEAADGAVEAHEEHDHHDHHHDHEHEHNHHEDHHHHHHHHDHDHDHEQHSEQLSSNCETPLLPTAEAVEKLQSRFTTLISRVADLTEEKQSLEHLVLQLQSETETIGEYIALYQTQRRMLKQREYEKATQMRLLQAEREQLREKIDALNQLVGSLGLPADHMKPDETEQQKEQEQQLPVENENSQEIINKIQDIITEIKVNAEQSPTSLINPALPPGQVRCCQGKFEVV